MVFQLTVLLIESGLKLSDKEGNGRVEMVRSLLHPSSVTIVGATPRPGSWAEGVYRNLRRFGYPGSVYLMNARHQMVWDEPCYGSFADLPSKPDHLVVLVPSPAVVPVLRDGAAAGARSATVYAGGFGEGGDEEGKKLGALLKAAVDETGLAVSGPNCLGNLSARAQMVTLTERRQENLLPGRVALVGQSGGVVLYLNSALQHRGIPIEYAVTSGNEVGLSMADYVAFFAEDPNVGVIVTFIESIRHLDAFFAACRTAAEAGKVIVAIKIGDSPEGRAAALAHTGALAGSLKAFDAVCSDLGIIRVENLDEAVELTDYLAHTTVPRGTHVAAMVHSGGLRELLLESASRIGLTFPKLSDESINRLNNILPVGCYVGNPLDSGWGGLSSSEIYFQCAEILLNDPNVDVLLAQERLPPDASDTRSEAYIRGLDERAKEKAQKPIAIFTMVSDGLTDYGRSVRMDCDNVAILQEVDKTLKTLQRVCNFGERQRALIGERSSTSSHAISRPWPKDIVLDNSVGVSALNEAESKRVLALYGINSLPEEVVSNGEEAVDASGRLGFPLVVKALARDLPHKSDYGLVLLNVGSTDELIRAVETIRTRAESKSVHLDGILLASQAPPALEVVLGVQRDSEVGHVVMFGAGGVWLELYKDVAFSGLPISHKRAEELISKTQVGKIIKGYRGGPTYDIDALCGALVGLGELASDHGDQVEAIDVNPFIVLPEGGGGFALDALVVARGV